MSMMQTYHGVVRKGRIHITPPTDLPEGSEVYVVVTGQTEQQLAESQNNEMLSADTAVAREEAAFYRMHVDLLQKYLGEYVAVYNEEMVDHDRDQVALYLRIKARYPGQFVWIASVRETAVEEYIMHPPRFTEPY
jgi:hypothetical protein